jgi:hypothetical protein
MERPFSHLDRRDHHFERIVVSAHDLLELASVFGRICAHRPVSICRSLRQHLDIGNHFLSNSFHLGNILPESGHSYSLAELSFSGTRVSDIVLAVPS